jgi:hypothetical protein
MTRQGEHNDKATAIALTFSNQSVETSQFTKKRTYVSNAKNDATSMLSFTIVGRMAWRNWLPRR